MQENQNLPENDATEPNKKNAPEMTVRSPFLKKVDNFFYHYKWHTIISLFLVAVILICTLQTCRKEPFDAEVLYAGPASMRDKQTVLDIQNAFAQFTEDKNGDGKNAVQLVSYWVDEKYYDTKDPNGEMGTSDLAHFATNSYNNEQAYIDEITAGNLSLCLVSPHLFYLVHKEGGFMRIDEICPSLAPDDPIFWRGEGGDINHYAVQLSKTDFGKLPGLSSLPSDTILCIRKPAYHLLNASRLEEQHEAAKRMLIGAINYQSPQ